MSAVGGGGKCQPAVGNCPQVLPTVLAAREGVANGDCPQTLPAASAALYAEGAPPDLGGAYAPGCTLYASSMISLNKCCRMST